MNKTTGKQMFKFQRLSSFSPVANDQILMGLGEYKLRGNVL